MRRLDPAMWERHSRISASRLNSAFRSAAEGPWRIDFCGEIEGPGLWNCGMAEWIEGRPGPIQRPLRAAYSAFHRCVTPLPVPPFLRPNLLLVATRVSPEAGRGHGTALL
jgi:hypothetical protein